MFQSFHFHFLSATYFLCFIQVDDTPPSASRSGRLIELLPSGPISLIGNNAPTLAALMHRGVRLKKVTTKRMKTSPSVAATALAQAFKVNSQILQLIPIPFLYLHNFRGTSANMGTSSVTFTVSIRTSLIPCYTCTHKFFIIVSAYRHIGKD